VNCALTSASRHHSALATLRFESVIGKSPPLSHDAPRLHTPAGCMSHEHALAPSGSHPATPNPTTDLALSNRQRTFPLIPPLVLPGRILPHLRTPAADLAPHHPLSSQGESFRTSGLRQQTLPLILPLVIPEFWHIQRRR